MDELCAVYNCHKPKKNGDKYCSMHRARSSRTGRLDKKSLIERIEEKVERIPESGCWIWLGFVNQDGYGRFRVNGKKKLAHRVSWEHFNGIIPKGILVCHKCDVQSCLNPDHLFLGTASDNHQDAVTKGRIDPIKRVRERWIKCPTHRKQS